MADSQQEDPKDIAERNEYGLTPNIDNRHGAGNKVGSKRTTTLVKELYEDTLLKVSKDRLPAIMKQIAKDADDPDLPPHVRQKAQAMIMQAAQKAGDQEIEKEKMGQGKEGMEIEISRDGVLVRSGRNQVRINGGGGSRQVGGEDTMVPCPPYPTPQSPELPDGFKDELYMPCAPNTSIPLLDFVGPHRDAKTLTQCFVPRIHNDPVLNAEIKYQEYLCIDRPASMNFNTEVIDG